MRNSKISQYALSLVSTLAFLNVGSVALAENYNPSNVLYALGHPDARLKIITSHRGQYSAGCVENSICSVRAAAAADIESVEIDVKESKDGTLWPFHDMNVGRVTNYTYEGRLFNPFTEGVDNSLANPAVASLTDRQLNTLKLRDADGNVSQYWASDLKTLLTNIKNLTPNMAVILDIKTSSAVARSADLIRELNMGSSVVMKFSVGMFAPENILASTKGYRFTPTVYMGDLDRIYSHDPLRTPALVIADYLHRYTQVAGYTYVELGGKEFRGSGSNWALTGEMGEILFLLKYRGMAVGNFVPVLEKAPDARTARSGYYRSNGSCCASLNDYLTQTRWFGTEQRDDRTNMHAQVSVFNNILTDNGAGALQIARSTGARADLYKIIR